MAVSGGATTAYYVSLKDGRLKVASTSCLRSYCADPADAVPLIEAGQRVVVAGGDMTELYELLAKKGIGV